MQSLLECFSNQLDRLELDAKGVIKGYSKGNSPYWLVDGLDLEKQYFHVRLKVIPETDDPAAYYYCKLYFLEAGQEMFDEAHSQTLTINRFGEFDDYNFTCLAFQQRKIVAVRLHPFSHRGRIEMKEFGFRPYAQLLLDCCSFQLDRLELDVNGVIKGYAISDSPYWFLDGLDLEKQYFHVRLKVIPETDDPAAYYILQVVLSRGWSGRV